MTIEAPDALPETTDPTCREAPSPAAEAANAPRPARRGAPGRRLWRLGRWILLLALVGLNSWWFWRENRPLVGLDTLAQWVEQHRDREAEPALRQRLARSPHDGEARILLARLLAQRDEMLACARELHQVPFWWPDKARWLVMEAGAFKKVDRMSDAEAAWKAVVEDDPLHPVEPKLLTVATRDLLELYAFEGRFDDATRLIWGTYDRIDDTDERARLLSMRLRTELERIMPAVAAARLEKFLAADPQDWEARRGLAGAKLALNLLAEARDLLETCLRERPADPRGWADFLELLHTAGDLDGLRQAVAGLPAAVAEHPAILTHRARLLERDRRWPEAAELYNRLLQARPFERETYYRLALLDDRLGRRDQGRAHRERWEAMRAARTELNQAFQKVLDLHQSEPDSPRYHGAIRRLAQVCKTLGWTRDAEGWARLIPAT
jgi:tetratricopeptide (TPR) repeat protein